jgi:diguanylate cyclase (GGDEF)-like protein
MNKLNSLISSADRLTKPMVTLSESEQRRTKLLGWILVFVLLFCTATLIIMLIFNPENDPQRSHYVMLIGGLLVLFSIMFTLNRTGYYLFSATLLVAIAAFSPWVSMIFDPSIHKGDFVPLIYATFSILMSSILLPLSFTIILAIIQLVGVILVFFFSPATPSFNWFSFLAFIFLTSVFSIIVNNIIQRNMKEIDAQAHQLALNEVDLRERAIRDYLTNLFNRRYLEETLEREIQRAKRDHGSLGLILLDVDDFKDINDSLGHAAGDTVLRELGKFLTKKVRQSDIACRYGGDEFVLVMPDATQAVTMARAEQLRDGVKDLVIDIKDQNPVTITFSLGMAVFPKDGSSSEAILRSADSALYRAKREGSDRVGTAG